MLIEIKAPSPGESISEVQVATWLKADGTLVKKNDVLCEIESDKATLEVTAQADGALKILVPAGEVVRVGTVLATISTSASASTSASTSASADASAWQAKILAERGLPAAAVARSGRDGRSAPQDAVPAAPAASMGAAPSPTPAVPQPSLYVDIAAGRPVRREKMSMLRRRLSQRLVQVKNQTAMLTTFNEVDMGAIMGLRKQHQEAFVKKHGVKLGFMSFFVRAVAGAMKAFPAVNAMIDGDEVVYHDFLDIGIAVSAPKGLVVPPLHDADTKHSGQIEQEIVRLAEKARANKLTIEEMTGGTFTITNGGVFGSMLSTPILNPPQSAILGMHNMVDRPVARDGAVVIRPVMYVALSYDHRIIDGRESVGFLKTVKEQLEAPEPLLAY